MEKESLKKEIKRLVDIEKIITDKYSSIKNIRRLKIKKEIPYIKYIYSDNIIVSIGEKDIYYIKDNKNITFKIKSCKSPFIKKQLYSHKQMLIFEHEILKFKNDFKSRGKYYQIVKKHFSLKNIDSDIDKKINKLLKKLNDIEDDIIVGNEYDGVKIKKGYYYYNTTYFKVLKENNKTYNIEYMLKNDKKMINKRINKKILSRLINNKVYNKYNIN